MQKRLERAEKHFLGIQVGRGDEIEGRRVSIAKMSDEELETTLRNRGDGVTVIDMAEVKPEQIDRLNSRRDATIGAGVRVVLVFPDKTNYGKFVRRAPDWNQVANVVFGDDEG